MQERNRQYQRRHSPLGRRRGREWLILRARRRRADRRERGESFKAIYSQASCHSAFDGGHPAGGYRRLSSVARFRLAGSGLPDDPGADLLSRGQPGRDGLLRHRAAGASIRTGARPQPDDFKQLRRVLGHHAAIRARAQHRCGRAGSAGLDQCCLDLSPNRSAQPARLQQDQPGRRADPDFGADQQINAAG